MYVCVHAHTCTDVCVCRCDVDIRYLPQLPSTLLTEAQFEQSRVPYSHHASTWIQKDPHAWPPFMF